MVAPILFVVVVAGDVGAVFTIAVAVTLVALIVILFSCPVWY